ncbi:hypothetical protein [Ruminiclostridium cellobioparum]|uniref:Uncharacterized protein n=1 Tax=Ruminiclostridium cellobioparum subsp. termitidis CT1112 TaxID=1195236 RepID=S0FGH0_RUMCE|nr:hypothetical protein [Ruminiclostridium cellobioparum]EMS70545.1 hypothetical protein CTER_3711 [Ruminiclostridium cellobioparum subsp. termitidis CT1112]
MEFLKLMLSLSQAVRKNDVAKGCLLGGATAIGTGGAVYIAKKLLEKKKSQDLNINIE